MMVCIVAIKLKAQKKLPLRGTHDDGFGRHVDVVTVANKQ